MKTQKMKIKKIAIFVIIWILIGVVFWLYQHQQNINICKERCVFIAYERESYFPLGEKLKADYWRFDGHRKFKTQEQCINYCLIKKQDREEVLPEEEAIPEEENLVR